jgi:hypothetical protein
MFRSEAGPLAIPIQRCQLLISGSIVVNIKSFSRNRSLPPGSLALCRCFWRAYSRQTIPPPGRKFTTVSTCVVKGFPKNGYLMQ